jgi:hypothetical protein
LLRDVEDAAHSRSSEPYTAGVGPAAGNKETTTMKETFNLTNEDELIEALKQGAVVIIGPNGAQLAAHDDLPPEMRECIRISRAVERIPRVGALLDMSAPGHPR